MEPGAQFIERRGGVQVQQLDADNDAKLIKIDVDILIELDGAFDLATTPAEVGSTSIANGTTTPYSAPG